MSTIDLQTGVVQLKRPVLGSGVGYYVETIIGLDRGACSLGVKPLYTPEIKAQVVAGTEIPREVPTVSTAEVPRAIDRSQRYRLEGQVQINPPAVDGTFYLRAEQAYVLGAEGSQDTEVLTGEGVYKTPDETLVVRAEVIVNNPLDPENRAATVAVAPFVKTPAVSALFLKNIRFRVAPEYKVILPAEDSITHNGLLLHTKIEGTIISSPWWGWGVQVFYPIDIEGDPAVPLIDYQGAYLWVGGFVGEGLFGEGGVYVASDFSGGSFFGATVKVKSANSAQRSEELRWWQ